MATPDLNSQLQALALALNRLTQTQSAAADRAEKDRLRRWRDEQDLHASTELHIQSITKGRKLNEQQLELEQKLRTAKQKELDLLKDIRKAEKDMQDLERNGKKGTEEYQKAQNILKFKTGEHGKAVEKTIKTGFALERSFHGLFKGVNLVSAALTYFGAALKNSINLARDQMVANQGVIEGASYLSGMMTQQGEAFKRGIDPVQFAKITTANRQMINAMGGTTNAMASLESSALDMYTMTGNQADAYKLLLEASTSFAQKGIKPTQQAIQGYTRDVKVLAMQTGMSAEAAASFYSSVSDDVDSITLLRAARVEEREAILKSQRAMLQNAIAAGMSAEQAKEAAKMLNKMVAARPLDRIKQAARIRAIGGALGIAGANEAAQATIAGKNATAAQKEQLMKFHEAAANKVDKASQGGLGNELMVDSLVNKLGMENQYGPGSPFSTTLGTTLANPLENTISKYSEASNSLVGQGLQKLDMISEYLRQVASGTIVLTAIMTGFQSIFALFTGENVSNWMYEGLTKAIPGFMEGFGTFVGVITDGLNVIGAPIHGLVGLLSGLVGGIAKLLGGDGIASALFGFAKSEFHRPGEAVNNLGNTVAKVAINQDYGPGQAAVSGTGQQLIPAAPKSGVHPIAKLVETAAKVDAEKKKTDDTTVKATHETADASRDTATGIQTQLRKMDDNAVLMQKLVTNSDKAIELAEKQLIALTMTEKERTEGKSRSDLRKDNRFGAQYNYL